MKRSNVKAHMKKAAFLFLASVSLVACTTTPEKLDVVPPTSAADSFEIKVAQVPVDYAVNPTVAARKLTPNMKQDLRNLSKNYFDEGTSPIVIFTPTHSANEKSANLAAQKVRSELIQNGVPTANVRIQKLKSASADASPPLRVSYKRLQAITPACGIWDTNIKAHYSNKRLSNFGCATQQNLAAMVVDPSKLISPDPLGSVSTSRRLAHAESFATATEEAIEATGVQSRGAQ